MILDLKLERNEKGTITSPKSEYNPDKAVRLRTSQVIQDMYTANIIRNQPYEEFNNETVLSRLSKDLRSFNQYAVPPSSDPDQAWRSTAFRPITRNKCISIAAHIAASVIAPNVLAQNQNDEEDKEAANIMRDLMEWSNDQSNYDFNFMYAVINALITPACIVHTEYTEVKRKIKIKNANGKITEKEVIDEEYSGFQDTIVPTDELWIGNIYEKNIQRQPFLIWRRVIDYSQAKEKYQGNEIFDKYVTPGVQFLYNDENDTFYKLYDESLQNRLVEEIVYYNRGADLQLRFVNGILLDDVDNPNPRKDKMYPFAKTGYELINEGNFFYYKSLPFKLSNDEQIINTAYQMLADATYLQTFPPMMLFSSEVINSDVIAPGLITTIDNQTNPNAAAQPINTGANLASTYNLLDKVESSVSESSTDILQTGQSAPGAQTAYEISRLEQNSRVVLGLFGKMIAFMVKDWGKLRMGDILQFMTVGQASKLQNGEQNISFMKFLLPDKTIDGKKKTKRIEFDMELPEQVTDEQELLISADIAALEKKAKNNTKIIKVNPKLFRNLKYKIMITPQPLTPRSEALERAQNLEQYGLGMANPYTNKEALTRDLLFGSFPRTQDDPDKYMMETQTMGQSVGAPGLGAQQPPQGQTPEQQGFGQEGIAEQAMQNVNNLAAKPPA